MDVNFTGSKYTWWNGRTNQECIFKRLDRVLVNLEFMHIFSVTEVERLIRDGLDHAPIQVVAKTEVMNVEKSFRFQTFWCNHKEFIDMVKETWKANFVGDHFLVLHAKRK